MKNTARISALQILLRPIVRLMLEAGHTIQDFIEVLKLVYVRVAEEQLEEEGESINPSRLVMTTGIHRLEVNRLLEVEEAEPPEKGNMLARILGQWEQKREFRDKRGRPKVLTYKGKNSQFAKLLRSISLCLTPGTVLFELERHGAVERTPKGLKLIKNFQGHGKDSNEKYAILAEDVRDLVTALQENMNRPPEEREPGEFGNLHLRTEYDNILIDHLPEIREWLVQEGKEFHRRAREYLAQFDKDVVNEEGEAGGRVVLTAFGITEPNALDLLEEPEDEEDDDDLVENG